MPFFYIAEPGYEVDVAQHRLRLLRDERVCYEAPLAHCDGLVAFGHVEVRRSALDALMAKRATIAFLDLFGSLTGYALPPMDRAVEHRLLQAGAILDPGRRLEVARVLCERKLDAMARVAAQRSWNAPDPQVQRQVEAIRGDLLLVHEAPSLEALRGLEGIGTRRYYRTLSRHLRPPFAFSQRSRQPPKDPFNSLLSLGGVLLAHEAVAALVARGLDPYLGFLHASGRGHPALALDLLEPLRPAVVDRWALSLLNRRVLRSEHFAPRDNGGVYLADPDARRTALRDWRDLLDEPPQAGVGAPSASARKALGAFAEDLVRRAGEGLASGAGT